MRLPKSNTKIVDRHLMIRHQIYMLKPGDNLAVFQILQGSHPCVATLIIKGRGNPVERWAGRHAIWFESSEADVSALSEPDSFLCELIKKRLTRISSTIIFPKSF
jgi:hypothetical protein